MSLVKRNSKFFKNKTLMIQEPNLDTPAEDRHSIFGASCASRWRTCPGSVNVIQRAKEAGKIPKQSTSVYADEGTEATQWAEKVLKGECGIEELPDEFRLHLTGYINLCNSYKGTDCREFIETPVPLFYRPEDFGKMDFATWNKTPEGDELKFVDLKYGVGVKVDVEENDQQIIYLLSLVRHIEETEFHTFKDDTSVSIAIYQPRHHTFDGEAETWTTTLRDLKDVGIDIEADYKVALKAEETELNPSPKACQFCDIKGICTVRAQTKFDPLIDFEDETAPALKLAKNETLSPQQIAFFCEHGKELKKIIDDIAESEEERLKAGGEIQFMKMVPSDRQGNRRWEDIDAAETFLKGQLPVEDRYAPRQLITAPQALSKLKPRIDELSTVAKAKLGLLDEETAAKCKTKSLIFRPEGQPKLVPISDKREAIIYKAAGDEFEDETALDDLGDLI